MDAKAGDGDLVRRRINPVEYQREEGMGEADGGRNEEWAAVQGKARRSAEGVAPFLEELPGVNWVGISRRLRPKWAHAADFSTQTKTNQLPNSGFSRRKGIQHIVSGGNTSWATQRLDHAPCQEFEAEAAIKYASIALPSHHVRISALQINSTSRNSALFCEYRGFIGAAKIRWRASGRNYSVVGPGTLLPLWRRPKQYFLTPISTPPPETCDREENPVRAPSQQLYGISTRRLPRPHQSSPEAKGFALSLKRKVIPDEEDIEERPHKKGTGTGSPLFRRRRRSLPFHVSSSSSVLGKRTASRTLTTFESSLHAAVEADLLVAHSSWAHRRRLRRYRRLARHRAALLREAKEAKEKREAATRALSREREDGEAAARAEAVALKAEGPRRDDGPRLRGRARGGRASHAARGDELRRALTRAREEGEIGGPCEEGEVEEKCAELRGERLDLFAKLEVEVQGHARRRCTGREERRRLRGTGRPHQHQEKPKLLDRHI
ncbi:hypothetical protein FB451DRAFT_1173637 [Mycena latifolia]|nr:hypothetical protein FB451DRAFT_1173637 [Mycena latifolia]